MKPWGVEVVVALERCRRRGVLAGKEARKVLLKTPGGGEIFFYNPKKGLSTGI